MKKINDLNTFFKISNEIVKELKKSIPDLDEPYSGQFSPYIKEYIKTFILPMTTDIELHRNLTEEVIYIECFCKWLDKEKKIKIKKT